MSDRPSGVCVTHRPPRDGHPWRLPDSGYTCCSPCYDKIHHWLSPLAVDDDGRPDSVPSLYALLNPRPGSVVDSSGIRPPGFGSRSPANNHVVVIRDRRSKSYEVARDGVQYVWDPEADNGYPPLPPGVFGPERPPGAYVEKRDVWFGSDNKAYCESTTPVRSVLHVLGSWTELIAEERGVLPVHGAVVDLCGWLDRNLDWITRQQLVSDFANDLQVLYSQLRAIGQPRQKIGDCPNTIDDGDHTRKCGAKLFAPLYGDQICCWACRRQWPRDEWLRLGDLLDTA